MSLAISASGKEHGPGKLKSGLRNLFRFACVGALVFALDFTLIYLLEKVTVPMVAVSIAFFTAITAHFCLNKWWVFGVRQPCTGRELCAYGLNALLCWACTVLCVKGALAFWTSHLLLAKVAAVPPTMALGFCLMRFVVFRPTKPAEKKGP